MPTLLGLHQDFVFQMKIMEQGQSEAGVGVAAPSSAMACTGLERRGNTTKTSSARVQPGQPAQYTQCHPSLGTH